jgi:hypothetical protein
MDVVILTSTRLYAHNKLIMGLWVKMHIGYFGQIVRGPHNRWGVDVGKEGNFYYWTEKSGDTTLNDWGDGSISWDGGQWTLANPPCHRCMRRTPMPIHIFCQCPVRVWAGIGNLGRQRDGSWWRLLGWLVAGGGGVVPSRVAKIWVYPFFQAVWGIHSNFLASNNWARDADNC